MVIDGVTGGWEEKSGVGLLVLVDGMVGSWLCLERVERDTALLCTEEAMVSVFTWSKVESCSKSQQEPKMDRFC